MTLGPAPTSTVDPVRLMPADELARRLGVDVVEAVSVEVVDYALENMTTGARWWVTGETLRGSERGSFRLFVKLVRTVRDSPVMAFVPPHVREQVVRELPWEVEPDVYESSLAAALPSGTRLPDVVAVQRLDADSALLWLEAVDAATAAWSEEDYSAAARALGELSGSAAAAEVADVAGHRTAPRQARQYWEGRLVHQFAAAYRSEHLWQHPVLARDVSCEVRDRLLDMLDAVPGLVAEIEELPLLTGHGDACPNNVLRTADGLVVVDWAYFGRHRVGFDLSQLVMSEIDLGHDPASVLPRRQELCLTAYAHGLSSAGVEMSAAELARAHAVQLVLAAGVSCIPLERLDDDADALAAHLGQQLLALDHILTAVDL